ncbi:hypothetical protein REPUB_Repub01dG0038300 [Reevesia pubescens]
MTNQDDEEPKSSPCIEREVVADDKLTVTLRKNGHPAHYILEIESLPVLSQFLSKTRLDRYESPEFKASGYKWRLILYPKGDEKSNGGDHISVYVEIMGTQNLGRAWEIDALLNFFVHDHRAGWISFQDGRVKRFNAVKKEWGFSRLLPLTEFNDTSKGYLRDQKRCSFGVEVFVIRNEGKGECFSTLENPIKNKFIWKVEKFNSKLKEAKSPLYSEEFTIEDYKWKLHLYLKGVPKMKEQFLSIFLCLQGTEKISFGKGSKMHVEFKLRIIYHFDENNPKQTEKTGNAWFSAFASAWGFPYFIKLDDLTKAEGLIVVKDDVVFEAEICSISMTKDLSPDPPKPIEAAEDIESKPSKDKRPF